MALPSTLFASAFRRQKLGFLLTLILIIMVYLGGLAMAAQAVLVRASLAWGHDLESRLTVEIPVRADEPQSVTAERAQKVLASVLTMPDVEAAAPIDGEETARLLKPWIEDERLLASLPLPRLIDVQMKPGTRTSPEVFKRTLASQMEDIQVHAHAGWMDSLLGFVHGLGALAGVMLFLTSLALVAVVSIVCRAAMAFQHDTIELLHFFGATDVIIARQFQHNVHVLVLRAALIGFGLAVLTVGLLALMLGVLGGLALVEPVSWITVAGVMALVPVLAWLLTLVTARWTVLKTLRRMA